MKVYLGERKEGRYMKEMVQWRDSDSGICRIDGVLGIGLVL
jgi:hypothetical protein